MAMFPTKVVSRRPCFILYRIDDSKELTPDNIQKEKGLFHSWANANGFVPTAIVETEDGRVCVVPYKQIQFADGNSDFQELIWIDQDKIHKKEE